MHLHLTHTAALYLPRLPRKIPGIVLPAGGRVEVLARCSGGRGTGYVLTAGPAAVKVFSDDGFNGNPYLQQQAVLATITMKVGAFPCSGWVALCALSNVDLFSLLSLNSGWVMMS
jgi:hypothetical protein